MYIALVGACWYISGTPIALVLIGYYVARSWDNLKQYDGLVKFLKYNIENDPKNPSAAAFLSSFWLGYGNYDLDAFVTAKDSVALNHDSYLANLMYARCLYKLNNVNGAIQYMMKAKSLTLKERPSMAIEIQKETDEMQKKSSII